MVQLLHDWTRHLDIDVWMPLQLMLRRKLLDEYLDVQGEVMPTCRRKRTVGRELWHLTLRFNGRPPEILMSPVILPRSPCGSGRA